MLPPLPAADTLAGGAIVGDNIGFWVGRELGPSLLARWAHLIGLDERKRMLGRYLFDRHGGKIVFFGRFVACCAPLRHLLAWRKRVASFAISHLQCSGGNCLGDKCSELADTYLEKAFAESQDHLAGRCSLRDRFCLPSLALLQKK